MESVYTKSILVEMHRSTGQEPELARTGDRRSVCRFGASLFWRHTYGNW